MESYDPLLLSRRVRHALADGVPAAELRFDLWVHDLTGVVRPAFTQHDPVTTHVSNAVALLSSANALGGWAALWAQGNTWFDGSAGTDSLRPVPIHCLPGSQLRRRPGVTPTESLVHPDEIIRLGRYQVASMARAAYDEMCGAKNLAAAVVACDMATSTVSDVPHTTPEAISAVLGSHHKVRGIVQARRAWKLSSTRSASPGESRTRLLVIGTAGLRRVLVNQPVFDLSGALVGIADLLDEEAGLVIESDGLEFHTAGNRTRDNHRQERFERAGLVVCRVTAQDHQAPWSAASRVLAARADAQSRTTRRWTTQTPTWWTSWKHYPRWA